ncbi:MAG: MBL fold metallo-hydrolase [Candidatus Woesearchaeota archaeon]|nr:MBL fold metallo-hydrolase [Candidatus Woesearchaeota archaeon]
MDLIKDATKSAIKRKDVLVMVLVALALLMLLILGGCKSKNDAKNNILAGNGVGSILQNESQQVSEEQNASNGSETKSVNESESKNESDKEQPSIEDVIITTPSNKTEENKTTALVLETSAEKLPLEVNFIDVGYGDSIFIRTPNNRTLLIDGGSIEAGPKVTKFLREKYKIFNYLDAIICTNPSYEHAGGLGTVLYNMMQVAEVYDNGQNNGTDLKDVAYAQFHQFGNAKGMFLTIKKDTAINIDPDVKINLIVPYKDGYMNYTGDNSIVVKLTYKRISMLFMGDCTKACEDKLQGYDLKADILKIGNHGYESTYPALLSEISPDVAIISFKQVKDKPPIDALLLKRLKDNEVGILRTDVNGTISIISDGNAYTIKTER